MIARRGFLLGLAAALATPAIAQSSKFMSLATAPLSPAFSWRAIDDINFSCMPTGEELQSPNWREDPLLFKFLRGGSDYPLLCVQLNPRASMRWVGLDPIIMPNGEMFIMDVEPCHTMASLNICFNAEKDLNQRHKRFAESFTWKDDKLTSRSIAAFDPRDYHMIEGHVGGRILGDE